LTGGIGHQLSLAGAEATCQQERVAAAGRQHEGSPLDRITSMEVFVKTA
jgi:hypothetical protein